MYSCLVFIFSLALVFGDRVGDYNRYSFSSSSIDLYPRCRITGCKAPDRDSLCSSVAFGSTTAWEYTDFCSAQRNYKDFLTNSGIAANNLTLDILLNSVECKEKNLAGVMKMVSKCRNPKSLAVPDTLMWLKDSSGRSCRNCPVCICSYPADANQDYFYDEYRYDGGEIVERACIQCSCSNITSEILSNPSGISLSDNKLADGKPVTGGWYCKDKKVQTGYSQIQDENWYCGPDTSAPSIHPTANPVTPVPQPTINPTQNPTAFVGCNQGNRNYSIGSYFFDVTSECTSFCKCMGPGWDNKYCKSDFSVIATDRMLQQGFFEHCGSYIGECFNANGTQQLFQATQLCNTTYLGHDWYMYCPRCPCSYVSKTRTSEMWNGSYVSTRYPEVKNGNYTNLTIQQFRCVTDYKCVNSTNRNAYTSTKIQPTKDFLQVVSEKLSSYLYNKSENFGCTAPPHYCSTASSPIGRNTGSKSTRNYPNGDYDYCYWRNFTSERTKTICLRDYDPTPFAPPKNQPVNLFGEWGASQNYLCEAFLNESNAKQACWVQDVSWTVDKYNCRSLSWESETITTKVRYSCCTASVYGEPCNNQTIKEGSKNCGSNGLLGRYLKTLWERSYGDFPKIRDLDPQIAALLECGVQPGVNNSVEEEIFQKPQVMCNVLKAYWRFVTQKQCDWMKLLDKSGQLSEVNKRRMWEGWQYSTSTWDSDKKKWYDHYNCTWGDSPKNTDPGFYPPYDWVKSPYKPDFPCLEYSAGYMEKVSFVSAIIALLFAAINF